MARTPHAIATTLMLVSLGLGIALVPQDRELITLSVKSGAPDSALDLVRRKLEQDVMTPADIALAARLFADGGDPDGAVALLETLVDDAPSQVEARRLLATYYRTTQNLDGYRRTLEQLEAEQPTPAGLRELGRLYWLSGQPGAQAEVLGRLLSLNAATRADLSALARLEAAAGRAAAAIAALAASYAAGPESFDLAETLLWCRLLLETGRTDEAHAVAERWLAPRDDADAAVMLAGDLARGGTLRRAAALLEPYAGPAGGTPRAQATLARLLIDAGEGDEALRRLEAIRRADALDDTLVDLYVAEALALGRTEQARQVAESRDFRPLEAGTVAGLARAGLAEEDRGFLERLRAAPAGQTLAADPLLAAQVALAVGDRAAALAGLHALAAIPPTGAQEALARAGLAGRLGADDLARPLVAIVLHSRDGVTGDQAAGLAAMAVRLGLAEPAAAFFQALLRDRPSDSLRWAWAITAAAAGQGGAVLATLADWAPTDPLRLEDLAHVAADARQTRLTVAVARRLADGRGADADLRRLAEALLAARRPAEALVPLRTLRGRGAEETELYAAALTSARRAGAPVGAEARAFWRSRLDAGAVGKPGRTEALYALLDLGAVTDALPVLTARAEADPHTWMALYVEAAGKAGQGDAMVAVLNRIGDRASLSEATRRAVADHLLTAGRKGDAERILLVLAARKPVDAPEVRQLFHLWGPRPQAEALAWIAERARAAETPDETAAWMGQLVRVGAPLRAMAVHEALPASARSPAVVDVWLHALADAGATTRLAEALAAVIPTEQDIGRLRRLAALARQARAGDAEYAAVAAILRADPEDRAARRDFGLLAAARGDHRDARHHLAAYLEQRPGQGEADADAEVGRAYVEALLATGDQATARAWIDRVTATPLPEGKRAFSTLRRRADLLGRVGRVEEARRIYETLIAERPRDKALRADLAAMLIRAGDLGAARTLLAHR